MEWEEKLRHIGRGVVVNKGVSVKYDGIRLPRFISEFLLSEFMLRHSSHDEAVASMANFIDRNIPQPGHISEWHNRLRLGERCELIDNVRVTVHLEQRCSDPQVSIPSIGLQKARIESTLLASHPRLLREGMWGKSTLVTRNGVVWLVDFRPFQVSEVSLDTFAKIRRGFSTAEWTEILVSTIGLAPDGFTNQNQQFILLSRLLPLVQSQLFLIEMGPPGTGKTFVLDKLSTRSFVVSGSKVSPAQLFYDIRSRTEGILRRYSAILLDEVDKVQDRELSEEVVNKLLKYMESGTFDRGGREFQSDASLMLVGNLPAKKHASGPVLQTMPQKLVHEAFLDRINGLIPGWELSPVMHSHRSLTQTWGFSADYFSEVLEQLRQQDWSPELRARLVFENCTIRDEKSVMRIVSGLAKLLHPDRNVPDSSLRMILRYSVDARQRLLDESAAIHGTKNRSLSVSVH